MPRRLPLHWQACTATALVLVAAAAIAGLRVGSAAARVCRTPECLALSALITGSVNASADPCEDFYEYACGNYRVNSLYDPAGLQWLGSGEPILMQDGISAVGNALRNRIFEMLYYQRPVSGEDPDVNVLYALSSSLYRSCISWLRKRHQWSSEESGLNSSRVVFNGILSHLLDSIGWRAESGNGWFERALAKMVRYGVWPLVEVGPIDDRSVDGVISAVMRGNISQVPLSHRISSLDASDAAVYAEFFATLSNASVIELDQPGRFADISRELKYNLTPGYQTFSDAETLKAWENCTAGKALFHSRARLLTIGALDDLSKCADPRDPFSWTAFFEGVRDGGVRRDTRIDIRSLGHAIDMVRLVNFLKSRSVGTREGGKFSVHFSYIIFDWLISFGQFLPTSVKQRLSSDSNAARRLQVLSALDGDSPTDDCMGLVKALLGPAVERMFTKLHHEEAFDHVRKLIDLIQNATIESVRSERWITPRSKNTIAEKIRAMKREIGFDVVSAADMKKFYASTIRSYKRGNFTSGYEHFGTVLSLAMCAYAGRRNNLLSSDTSRSFLSYFDALTVNAFNYLQNNRIIFPMGILSPFFYHRSYPEYMNLGGIGVIIGHEIGHGFDNAGHELNKQGSAGHFWDLTTEGGYLKRMTCVSSRFSGYEFLPGQLHNSKLTLGNDIADIMGIRSAFNAMRVLGEQGRLARLPNLPEGLTPEKLFFVQAARIWCSKWEPDSLSVVFRRSAHSPPHIRIRGMMENSRDFAEVFQCKPGQAMNPSKKCEFW